MKKSLKLWLFVTVFAVCAAMVSVFAFASEGDYVFTVEDGKAILTAVSSELSGEAVIPEEYEGCPVTKTADGVFAGENITSVVLPVTTEEIGENTFSGALSLKKVTVLSDECVIAQSENVFPEGVMLCANKDSSVYKYAVDYGRSLIPLTGDKGCVIGGKTKISGLKEGKITAGKITAKWTALPGAESYRLTVKCINTSSGKSSTKTVEVTSNSYSASATYNRKYEITVCPVMNYEENAFLAENSETLTTYTGPAAVKKLKTVKRSASSLSVSWDKASGADGYYVYRMTGTSSKTAVKFETAKNSITLKSLNAGTKYSFYVVAYTKKDGKVYPGAKSETSSSYTSPATPSISSLKSPAALGVKVSWGSAKGASGYQVEISNKKDFSKIIYSKKQKATSITKYNLSVSGTLYVRVKAYKTVGSETVWGAYSAVKSVKVSAPTLQFAKSSYNAEAGRFIVLTLKKSASNLDVKWSVSDKKTGKLSAADTELSRCLTALKAGTVTVTASVKADGKTYKATVKVNIKKASTAKSYSGFSKVPDFGEYFGIKCKGKETETVGGTKITAYKYSLKELDKKLNNDLEMNNYSNKLVKNGYSEIYYYNDEYGYYLYYINPKTGETVCVIFPNGANEIYIMPMKV